MQDPRPLDLAAFVESARRFQEKLARLKKEHPLEGGAWYPYDSMTAVDTLEKLLARDFHLLPPLLAREPVLDLGCADGDLAFLLESLGAEVDAVDYTEMNFNQLDGARRLKELLQSQTRIYSINLDWYFELPRRSYGLILFLGTLYHLKNPFYVLEALARSGAYCLMSTRVARRISAGGLRIGDQPVAYLLDQREANDDPTNYWILTEAGLLRLADRAGWSVVSKLSVGCLEDSDPTDPDADERMFLLLKSRTRHPDLHVRLLEGWHGMEQDCSRWTDRVFSFEVELPAGRPVKEFALQFGLPGTVLAAGKPVTLTCEVNGEVVGVTTYRTEGCYTFRGVFPNPKARKARLRFRVDPGFMPPGGDTRCLGVRVSFADELAGGGSGLPFRVS